jgi:DNA-binding response OmpR family regulator
MSKILVVEDNDAVALGLQYGLEKEGFVVMRASMAREAQKLAPDADLIILDIRLPDGDGFDLCRQLRAANLRQPVLMLTARDELIDKVVGLEVGADDYMTKPYELREVIARIRALIRRAYGPLADPQTSVLHLGPLVIDFMTQRVTRGGTEVRLTATEFKLLAYLAQHPNQPHDREALLSQVWDYKFYEGDSRTVDVHIRNLRRKIERDPAVPELIVTVRGSGYRLSIPG